MPKNIFILDTGILEWWNNGIVEVYISPLFHLSIKKLLSSI